MPLSRRVPKPRVEGSPQSDAGGFAGLKFDYPGAARRLSIGSGSASIRRVRIVLIAQGTLVWPGRPA